MIEANTKAMPQNLSVPPVAAMLLLLYKTVYKAVICPQR
jgi:hypothetical protein